MSLKLSAAVAFAVSVLFLCNCTNDEGPGDLMVTWEFSAGDCASNNVEKVRVRVTSADGDTLSGEASCGAAGVNVGSAGNKTYTVIAQGMDANGTIRAENYATTVSFSGSMSGSKVGVTLHPKASKVRVNWNGCPAGVILPFFITLYKPPLQVGGPLTDQVTYNQVSCGNSSATLNNVQPGNYIVELDSRAISPKVYGTKPVTVVAGEDAEVTFTIP
jgi:hypothetical protein